MKKIVSFSYIFIFCLCLILYSGSFGYCETKEKTSIFTQIRNWFDNLKERWKEKINKHYDEYVEDKVMNQESPPVIIEENVDRRAHDFLAKRFELSEIIADEHDGKITYEEAERLKQELEDSSTLGGEAIISMHGAAEALHRAIPAPLSDPRVDSSHGVPEYFEVVEKVVGDAVEVQRRLERTEVPPEERSQQEKIETESPEESSAKEELEQEETLTLVKKEDVQPPPIVKREPAKLLEEIDVAGTWRGAYSTSLISSARTTFRLRQSGANVTGKYRTSTGVFGTATGTFRGTAEGDTIVFTLRQTAPRCPGSFSGTAKLVGNKINFTFSGSDCLGHHANGQGCVRR